MNKLMKLFFLSLLVFTFTIAIKQVSAVTPPVQVHKIGNIQLIPTNIPTPIPTLTKIANPNLIKNIQLIGTIAPTTAPTSTPTQTVTPKLSPTAGLISETPTAASVSPTITVSPTPTNPVVQTQSGGNNNTIYALIAIVFLIIAGQIFWPKIKSMISKK